MCREFEVDYAPPAAIVSFCYADAFEKSYLKLDLDCETLAADCIANPPQEILSEVDLGCDTATTQNFQQECTATVGDLDGCFASISNLFTVVADGLNCSNVLQRVELFEGNTPDFATTEAKCPEFK